MQGVGVKQNYEQTFYWYNQLVTNGHIGEPNLNNLLYMYEMGVGTSPNK